MSIPTRALRMLLARRDILTDLHLGTRKDEHGGSPPTRGSPVTTQFL
jgi:hypothetical protein